MSPKLKVAEACGAEIETGQMAGIRQRSVVGR